VIDVLVAGGGPAGLAAAIHAALAGLEAVVVEPRTAPVDKACGEGVMPGGVAALRALGVDVTGRELRGIRYVDGVSRAEASFRGRGGLGIRRTTLHSALHQRALSLGVRILTGKVGEVYQSADTVTAAGTTARWLVAADGLHSPVRRSLSLELPGRPHGRYGLRRHYRVEPGLCCSGCGAESPDVSCSSATPRATWMPSPARASPSPWRRPGLPSAAWPPGDRTRTSAPGYS
jgi:2-polyprenyl-6-methoxyphenol hydroxylase-like FAD-dependent oxidoreductase